MKISKWDGGKWKKFENNVTIKSSGNIYYTYKIIYTYTCVVPILAISSKITAGFAQWKGKEIGGVKIKYKKMKMKKKWIWRI